MGKTPDGAFVPRQSTGFSDLKKAEAFRTSLLSEYRDDPVQGDTLAACISKYLASRENELGEKTHGQTKFLLERLQDYCTQRGVYNIRELSVDLLETFKVDGLAGLKSTSKGTSVAKLRCFLRAAFRRGWIGESLVDRVTPHRATYDQKQPYSDEEVQNILDESLKLKGGTHGYARRPQTFRLLLELMLETGMRVGDAILFDPKAVTKGERLWIYTYVQQKQKKAEKQKHVEAFLTDRLKAAIDESEWLSPRLPFAFGSSKNPSYLASEVYERMQTIGSRCGVSDCRPHRLRDTFAVRALLRGVQLEDVSRLLGHSSVRVTELYYSPWISHRKVRLERILADTLVDP
jgi:integrase